MTVLLLLTHAVAADAGPREREQIARVTDHPRFLTATSDARHNRVIGTPPTSRTIAVMTNTYSASGVA